MDICLIQTCSICHCSLLEAGEGSQADSGYAIPANCGHLFHKVCLKTWYKTSKNTVCPICRAHSHDIKTVKLDIEPAPNGIAVDEAFTKLQEKTRYLERELFKFRNDLTRREAELDEEKDKLKEAKNALEINQQKLLKYTKLCKQQKAELAVLKELKRGDLSDVIDLYGAIEKLEPNQQREICLDFCNELSSVRKDLLHKSNLLKQKQREIDRLAALAMEGTDQYTQAPNNKSQSSDKENVLRPRKRLKPLYLSSECND